MEILHADRHIAVCIKPVGMDSEKDVPAALITQLGGEIFPIHRLDQNVGGVMVYARTKAAAAQRWSYAVGGWIDKPYAHAPVVACDNFAQRTIGGMSAG